MTRHLSSGCAVLFLLAASEAPAIACVCPATRTFSEVIQSDPVVVLGRITAVGETPPIDGSRSDLVIAPRPFMGAGLKLAVAAVAKGRVARSQIRVWDLSTGDCANALRGQKVGRTLVVALYPVSDVRADIRTTWGAASSIPASDYMVNGACTQPLIEVNPEEYNQWLRRTLR